MSVMSLAVENGRERRNYVEGSASHEGTMKGMEAMTILLMKNDHVKDERIQQ